MAKKKDMFVWKAVRISFAVMILIWVIAVLIPALAENIIIGLIWIATTIFNFVNCIRHLKMYKEKGFAITSLVFSSLLLLLFLIGVIIGIIQAI